MKFCMELLDITFGYEIKKNRFSTIRYDFNVISNAENKEDVIRLAKSSLNALEQIINMHYEGGEFKKEKDGEVTSSGIKFWHEYSENIEDFRIYQRLTKLGYKISLNSQGNPMNLSLNLRDSSGYDLDSSRLLELFDSVVAMDNLRISNEAYVQIDRINFLRSQEFDVGEYLSLPDC